MHRHLVTVEVGVEGGTDQRVQLDRLALDQHRLEGLDAKSMQGRRAVEQHRMLADDFLEDIPDFAFFLFDQLLGRLDRRRQAATLQLGEDERLEKFQRHLFRQTALMQLEGRTNHDYRTTGVIDTFAEQVLTEPALLAFDHVGQRLQRALVGTGDRTATAAVVQQRIDRFLQHALFIAHDNVRRRQLQQSTQAIVAVDDAAIEIVEIGRRESSTIQRHQRSQIGWQHGKHGQNHVLGTVPRLEKGLDQLDPLGQALDLGLRIGAADLLAQLGQFAGQINVLEQVVDRLGTHLGVKFVAIGLQRIQILLVGQQLTTLKLGHHARIKNQIGLEVQNPLDVAQGHVEHQTNARRQRLQEPDVGHGAGQVDVTHTLAAHLGQGDLGAALFALHTAVLHALVLAAQALVVLDRSEDRGTEQTLALWLEGTVIDRLRLLDLAE